MSQDPQCASNRPGYIRIKFSERVDAETLRELHAAPLISNFPDVVANLFNAAHIERVGEVHRTSSEGIDHDNYGFAREFVCYMRDDADEGMAVIALRQSGLIAEVKLGTLRRPMN